MIISVTDKEYDRLVRDVARRLARIMKEEQHAPEFVSQRHASRLFGRANVERWKRKGLITPVKRPGKTEYRYLKFRRQFETEQDYE